MRLRKNSKREPPIGEHGEHEKVQLQQRQRVQHVDGGVQLQPRTLLEHERADALPPQGRRYRHRQREG